MSIAILLSLDSAQFDGTSRLNPNAVEWTPVANHQFHGQVAPDIDVGIIDPAEVLEFLRSEFGPFISILPPNVGSARKLTDFILERSFLFVGAATTNEIGVHSGIGSGGISGRRLRQGPEVMLTETSGMFQAGGSGQVSHTDFDAGQSGVLLVPSGQRIYVLSDAGDGNHQFGMWLEPLYAPRDIGKLVVAGQPPAQFS